jgi:hypothetical protein
MREITSHCIGCFIETRKTVFACAHESADAVETRVLHVWYYVDEY